MGNQQCRWFIANARHQGKILLFQVIFHAHACVCHAIHLSAASKKYNLDFHWINTCVMLDGSIIAKWDTR